MIPALSIKFPAALLVLALAAPSARAAAWRFEGAGGSAHSFSTPLKIRQDGRPDISLRANYDTNAFGGDAPYYAWRVGRWTEEGGWEFEHLHTKLILANKPADVQKFEVASYNYLFLNRAFENEAMVTHFGIGPVLARPESVIRGRTYAGSALRLAGVGAQLAVGRRAKLAGGLTAVMETKLTYARTTVPVDGGTADAPHFAVHYVFGLSFGY